MFSTASSTYLASIAWPSPTDSALRQLTSYSSIVYEILTYVPKEKKEGCYYRRYFTNKLLACGLERFILT